MLIAVRAGRMRQRVFEQNQQRLCRDVLPHSVDHMGQQPPRCRQRKRQARTVVSPDLPTIQRRRDLPCQHPVRGDQRGGQSIRRGLAQAQGNRFSLDPWAVGFD